MRLKWSRSMHDDADRPPPSAPASAARRRSWQPRWLSRPVRPSCGPARAAVALPGGVVRERGHRREALDQLDLRVGERDVGARAVDVQRADDAVVRDQRDRDERLGDLVRARRRRCTAARRRVFGTLRVRRLRTTQPVTPLSSGIALRHDLLDPVADGEHGLQRVAAVLDLVDREVVEAGRASRRWCAIRPSVPGSESAERMPAAASTSASSAESPAFAEDGMTDT